MHFRRRFTLLLVLGGTFSLALIAAGQSVLLGGFAATLAVVLNYWVALILHRRTVQEMQRPTPETDT